MINDILEISTDILPNTQKTAEDRGREQTIIHFETLEKVNEVEFRGSLDPIIIYTKKDGREQINVQPFNYDNMDKVSLSFEEKIAHYGKTTNTLYGNHFIESTVTNDESISIDTYDIGDYNDFFTAMQSPVDTGIDLEVFFGSIFLELEQSDLTDFQNGLGE